MRVALLGAALLLATTAVAKTVTIDLGKCEVRDIIKDGQVKYELGDCDWNEYVKSLIPVYCAAAIGLLILLVCPFFYCCRFCCGCCGGTYASPDHCCCPPKETAAFQNPDPYSKGHIMITKGMTIALAGLALVGMACGLAGASKEADAYKKAFDGAVHVPNFVDKRMDDVWSCLKRDPPPAGCEGDRPTSSSCYYLDYKPDSVVNDVGDETKKMRDDIEDAKSDADPYKDDVALGAMLSMIIPTVCLCCGVVFAALNVRSKGPMLLIACLFLFAASTFAGTVFAHGMIHKVMGDVCPELDKMVDGDPYNLIKCAIDDACDQKKFDDNRKEVEQQMTDGCYDACNKILDVCDPTDTPTSTKKVFWSPQCTSSGVQSCRSGFHAVDAFIDTVKAKSSVGEVCVNKPAAECTVRECANSCKDQSAKDDTKEALGKLDDAKYVNSTCFIPIIVPTLDCDTLFIDSAVKPQQATCDDAITGSSLVVAGGVLVGLALLLGICTQAHGAKAFVKPEAKHVLGYDDHTLLGPSHQLQELA